MVDALRPVTEETQVSAVSWAAILAGGVASAALTLLMLAFGTGMDFSVVSPWSNSGVSSTTFSLWAGLYLVVVAMMASSIGGYLAGRLRTKWSGVHTHERGLPGLAGSLASIFPSSQPAPEDSGGGARGRGVIGL
jgi:hypothetical protein